MFGIMSFSRIPCAVVLVLSSLSLTSLVWAQDTNFWITPSGPDLSEEKNYTIGEHVKLQWVSDFGNLGVCMTQYDHDDFPNCEWLEANVQDTGNLLWTVNTTRDYVSNPRFHARVIQVGNFSNYFWSPGFFIYGNEKSKPPKSATTKTLPTSSAPSPKHTGTVLAATTSPTKAKASATASTSPSSSSANVTPVSKSDGLSTGAKIAIGVSIPVAFLAGCAAVFFFLRSRQRRRYDPAPVSDQYSGQPQQPPSAAGGYHDYQPQQGYYHKEGPDAYQSQTQYPEKPQELQSSMPPQELSGASPTRA